MAAYMFHILKMNLIAVVVIIAALVLARITKRKYSSKWKYFMWLAVMVFLLFPLDFSAKSPVKLRVSPTEIQEKNTEKQSSRPDVKIILSHEKKNSVVEISSAKISLYSTLNILFVIWVSGMIFFAILRGLRYYFSLHGMMRWSYPASDTAYLGKYFQICRQKHIRKPPRLLICEGLPSPMLAGLRNTGLYIPEDVYGEKELEFIFSHELSHYLRRDLWYKMLMLAVTTIYWFNPALYLMQREAEKDIENLCDGRMTAQYTMKERMKYGELLLRFAASQSRIPYVSVSFSNSKRVFRDRILYMRNQKHLKKKFFPAVILSMTMIVCHLLVGSSIGVFSAETEAELVEFQPLEKRPEAVGTSPAKDERTAEISGENPLSGALPKTPEDMKTLPEIPEKEEENSSVIPEEVTDSEQEGTPGENAESAENPEREFTGREMRVLYIYGNGAEDISEAADGSWYDQRGRQYVPTGDGYWNSVEDGSVWIDPAMIPLPPMEEEQTTEPAISPDQMAVDEVYIRDEEGLNFETIYLGEDGVWRNIVNGIWTDNGDGSFTNMVGDLFYVVE